jgi:cytochrome P450
VVQNAVARSCPYSHAPTDFDPFDLTDPFPFYEWARQQDPVFFSPALNYYVVTRYDDIKAIFDDWRTFSSENAQAPVRPMGEAGKKILKDGGFTTYSGLSARVPPDHTRIRKLVQGCFGPRRFNAIEPQIRNIVNRAIDGFAGKSGVDFFAEFAYDVPALVLFKLIGVPDEDVAKVKNWAVSCALLTWGNLSDEEQIPHAHLLVGYWNYCTALVEKRKGDLTDDLPGDLIRLQREGADISDHEIASVLYSILFAGHETTTTLIANGVRELLDHRESWEAIVGDPAGIPNAIEEILRYSPTVIAWRRRTLAPAKVGGVEIPQGANLLLLLGSANRDEAIFDAPSRFEINRPNARNHIAFGYGIHYCPGQQLAKLELSIALQELTRRIPDLRLKPGQDFRFTRNTSFRVPTGLPVTYGRVAV